MNQEPENQARAFVMNLMPATDVEGQSPLHHAELAKLANSGPETGGVVLRELRLLGHLTLRCNPDNAEQLAVAERILGVALPVQPLTSAQSGERVIRWVSPDEWLLSLPGQDAFAIENSLQQQMPGHFSVVNGSGGLTVLQLSGEHVMDVLKKSVPVDLHIREFPVGKVVSTVFAKSAAMLHRTGEQQFELVIRRSFADYIWLWLQDASREYGLIVEA